MAVVGVIATFAVVSYKPVTPALAQLQLEEQEFQDYIFRYNKQYTEEEFTRRFQIFRDNSAYVRVFNTQGHTHFLGVNEFADMTFAEFKSIYTPRRYTPITDLPVVEFDTLNAPATVDWTTQGAVTPVKNQGQCGSCWSFSTTGSTEGAWFLAGHTLVSLSEQQLMDCSYAYGNQGCNGGDMASAMKYIIANGGLTSEANYPYTAKDGLCNKTKAKSISASLSSLTAVSASNSDQLMAAVAQQPVSVAVEADQNAWQLYKGGIVSKDCGTNLDHGVLVVGYDTTSTPQAWKVKNSWGASWGEAGFIRIAIVAGKGVCGIQMQPVYPIV